jgi:protein TonB
MCGGCEVRLRVATIFALAAGALAQSPPNTPGVSQPRLIRKQEPQDSDEARKARLEGRVGLSVIVSAEGAVQDVQVTKPAGLGLDENAMDAVRTWVFRPGMKDGQPVRVTTKVEVNFRHMVGAH